MGKYDNIVKKAKYAELVDRAAQEGASEISQATEEERFTSPRINEPEAISDANELTDTIDTSSEVLDIPEKLQAIVQASRERRFASPQIHQTEMGTRAQAREAMPGRKPLIWDRQPQFEEPREVVEMPRSQEADPILQAVMQTLAEPIMKLYEGKETIRISAREKDKTYEGVKKVLEAIPERHLESAMNELRSDEDIMRNLSATYGEGAIDMLTGLLHGYITPITAPFAGASAGLREAGLEPIAQGVEQLFDLPFGAIRFGSEVVAEGLDKMGFDFHRLENEDLDRKGQELLTEIGGLVAIGSLHAKGRSFVENSVPMPTVTKTGVRFKDGDGKFISKDKAKEKIEEIKRELPKDIADNPNFEVIGRTESGKPKVRYKGEPEAPKPEVKTEVPKGESPKADAPEILIANRSAAERMIKQGKTDADIAKALNIKPETVASVRTDMPNRVISFDLYEQTRKSAFEKGQRMGAGIDPTLLKDYSIIGAYHLENIVRAGVKKGQTYKKWSEKLIEDLGDKVKPHLKEVWDEVNKREDLNKLKTRRFAERTSEMPQFKDIAEDIKKAPESKYEPQKIADVQRDVKKMSDKELDSAIDTFVENVKEIGNTGILAGIEKIDRLIKRGEKATDTILKLAQTGTPLGQLIKQFSVLKGMSKETLFAILEGKFAEGGLPNLPNRLRTDLKTRTDKYTEAKKKADDFAEVLENNPTVENAKRAKLYRDKAAKTEAEVIKFMNRYLPKRSRDVYNTAIKGSLMAVTSIFKNPAWNVFGELMPHQYGKAMVVPIDWMHSKITGKPRTHYIDGKYYVEMMKGGWEGIKKSAEIMMSGRHEFITEKYEISRGFQPINAWKDLFSRELPRDASGKVPLSYRWNKLMEGTIGIHPEAIFRGLPFGDLPFKTARMKATAYEQGRLKGLKGEELNQFLRNPDKKTLDLMALEGDKSVFMQSNQLSNIMAGSQRKIGEAGDRLGKPMGAMGEILFTTQFPYYKVPTNALFLMMDYSIPFIPFAKSARFGLNSRNARQKISSLEKKLKNAKDKSAKDKLNNEIIELRAEANLQGRQAYTELGKALVGTQMWALSDWLVENNVVSGQISSNPKERAIEYQTKYPRSLNLTRLEKILKGEDVPENWEAGTDRIIDYETFGGFGVTLMMMAEYRKRFKKSIWDTKGLGDLVNISQTALLGSSKFLAGQSIAQGMHQLVGAVLSGDPKTVEKFFLNIMDVLITPALPNTLSAINRANQDYILESGGDTTVDSFLNIVNKKNPFHSRENPAYIRDIWGRPVKRPSDTIGKAGNIFYFFKTRVMEDDPVTFEIYDLYTQTEDASVLPPAVSNKFTYRNEQRDLGVKEHEKFQEAIGNKRLEMTKEYVTSEDYLDDTDEEKIEKINRIYREGYEAGKEEYVKTKPYYKRKKKKIKIIF